MLIKPEVQLPRSTKMKKLTGILFYLLCPFLLSPVVNGAAAPVSSSPEDQTALAVTVYNVNLGLVKDQRKVRLQDGTTELLFTGVASGIIPASVSIVPLSDPGSFRILEQNYEYDLLSPERLMEKYVGKEVTLYQKNPQTEREETVKATLLSMNGGPVYRTGDGITFGHPGRVILPGIPENLHSRPTLAWLLENRGSRERSVEATYLTNGLTWRADYVVNLNDRSDRADLNGWVTIDNRSGATYPDAVLKLVAGDVNRVREEQVYKRRDMKMEMAAVAPQFREEAFFEYHVYTLERPSTLKENQTKQISLLSAEKIPVVKELVFRGNDYYYRGEYGEIGRNEKVGVFLEIVNRKENGLGMPLPKGTVRVYQRDPGGSLQFVGEDSIDHTAKDENVRVKLGEAFDVVGTRKQTEWRKVASDTYEAAYEISLRNHKNEDVTVRVIEPVPGDWTVLSSSMEWKKTDSGTMEFVVPVKKDGEAKLTYAVRMRW
jgi:hypothetical protein